MQKIELKITNANTREIVETLVIDKCRVHAGHELITQLYTGYNDIHGNKIYYGDWVKSKTNTRFNVTKLIVAYWIIDSDRMNNPIKIDQVELVD